MSSGNARIIPRHRDIDFERLAEAILDIPTPVDDEDARSQRPGDPPTGRTTEEGRSMIVVLTAILAVTCLAALAVVKAIAEAQLRASLCAYRLTFPRGLEPDAAIQALSGFSGLLLPWWRRWLSTPFVSLEVHADHVGVSHHLVVPTRYARTIEDVLASALPSVRYEPEDVPATAVTRGVEYRLTSNDRPLHVDPAAVSVGLLATLQPPHRRRPSRPPVGRRPASSAGFHPPTGDHEVARRPRGRR